MPNPKPVQEIRFAVVMYGGVSLAIYINGVAQELLRMTRSTSGAADLDPVEKIYAEMSQEVRPVQGAESRSQDQSEPLPTRFIVDILSGTSAGGINAIFLAKALALGLKTLNDLRNTWLEVAGLDQLLNLRNPDQPKRSLLDGSWMYQQLYDAFQRMNHSSASEVHTPHQLDLFVTTTDLNGVPLPMRLSDMDIVEKVHKGSFHFRMDSFEISTDPAASATADLAGHRSDSDATLDTFRRNDFTAEFDPMLAFAARATSSFPLAFAPFKLADIKPIIGSTKYAKGKDSFLNFFQWIPTSPLVPTVTPVDIEDRELADGGYLNNKPFDHVVKALTFRASTLPHSRKLLFVDPFPEMAGEHKEKKHFSFLENSMDAAMTLPRYQTIRQEIERITERNRTLLRLGVIRTRAGDNVHKRGGSFKEQKLAELTEQYGAAYNSYHSVRLFDVTDDLARVVTGLSNISAEDDLFLAVRYMVRAWREAAYGPNGENGKQLETKFFTSFDYSYRLRRAIHLLEWAQKQRNSEVLCESLIRQITRLSRKRDQLSYADETNPLIKDLEQSAKKLTWEALKEILIPITDRERFARAQELCKDVPELKSFAHSIAEEWMFIFAQNREELQELRDKNAQLNAQYEAFDFSDMVSLAFLEGSDVSENTQTEIYRISPADSTKSEQDEKVDLDAKLAGYKLGAFGAFLKRDYRLNDILFGRLDASERIASAIFNQEVDAAKKDHFVEALRKAILEQEFAGGMNTLADVVKSPLPAADALRNYYALPADPDRKDSARQIAQVSDIVGRMFEDDLHGRGSVTTIMQIGGKLAAGMVSFLTPRTLQSLFLRHWLGLAGIAAALLYGIAYFLQQEPMRKIGLFGLIAVFVTWVLTWLVGRYLTNLDFPGWLKGPLKTVGASAVIAVIASGFMHVCPDLMWLFHKFTSRLSEIAGF